MKDIDGWPKQVGWQCRLTNLTILIFRLHSRWHCKSNEWDLFGLRPFATCHLPPNKGFDLTLQNPDLNLSCLLPPVHIGPYQIAMGALKGSTGLNRIKQATSQIRKKKKCWGDQSYAMDLFFSNCPFHILFIFSSPSIFFSHHLTFLGVLLGRTNLWIQLGHMSGPTHLQPGPTKVHFDFYLSGSIQSRDASWP